jgi:hypothetical protein
MVGSLDEKITVSNSSFLLYEKQNKIWMVKLDKTIIGWTL